MVDIAGLVAGSASGEGLGNRFLAGIREADAVCLVLRAFDDRRGRGNRSASKDLGVLELELVLADLAYRGEPGRQAPEGGQGRQVSARGEVGALEAALASPASGFPDLPIRRSTAEDP